MIFGSIIGDRALLQRFKAVPAAVKRDIDQTTDVLGLKLQASVQRDYLTGQVLKVRTNRLRGSIARGAPDTRSRFESTADASYAYVGTNVVYGRTWELGAEIPAMDIVAKRAKALRFTIGGQVLFRKSVHIPAHKLGPRPYLAPALQAMKPEILRTYDVVLHRSVSQTLTGS